MSSFFPTRWIGKRFFSRQPNAIETEFELFNVLSNISHSPENKLTQLKSKLRNVCHKYSKIKVPYNYQHMIDNLTNNETIEVLKQDKGRGVVIMDSSKYEGKYLGLQENDQFAKINDDSMKCIERKIQICKLKSKITEDIIQNCTRQVLTLANFMELPKFINFPIMSPLINFCSDQLHPILGLHLTIFLNTLQNYYPRSANQSTLFKIPNDLFKNLKTCLWIVIQS